MAKEKKAKAPKKQPPHMKELYACLQCGYCRDVCPVYGETGWESLSPRGKVFLLKDMSTKNSPLRKIFGKKVADILTGDGEISIEEVMEKIYTCTLCSACEVRCHVEIPFHEYWEEIRTWLVENGIEPPENTKNMYDGIANKEFMNPFMEKPEKRDEWYRDKYELPEKADIVYFTGCMSSFYEYQMLLSTMKIFESAGINFTTLGKDEMCCGAINSMTGQVDNFGDIAQHNIEQIKKRGATRVVTGCPACLRSLKKYGKYVKHDLEILHTMEFIEELINSGKLEFKKPFKEKNMPIIYHDPCELGRILEYEEDNGLFDQPRNILKSVPGIDEILEFPNNRMESNCCGGGGGLKAVNYDLSADISVRKIEEAMKLGAKTIVSACPNCKSQMGVALETKKKEMKEKGEKFKMKVMDVTEVVAKSI